jgi:protocatechuate 3,4-dioxygenase beta subunit
MTLCGCAARVHPAHVSDVVSYASISHMPLPRVALALGSLAALVLASPSLAQPMFAPPGHARLGPILILARPTEPGQRMVVTGRLFGPDGKAPLAGRLIGVYQTDATGNYGRDPRVPQWARLNGWLCTDSTGRYEIRTIRPGAYPQGNTPEHMHFVIETSSGFDGSTELRFDDDRRVSASDVAASRRQGRFGSVRPVVRGRDGILRVERDLRAR